MSSPNYAANIIVNLASLPEFLRKPMLQKRLLEFFSMQQEEKREIINNALQAGPTIQFEKFAVLFKTWLEILCNLSEDQRTNIFSTYVDEIISHPEKIISFNLDGVLEIFMSLSTDQKLLLAATLRGIIALLDEKSRRRLELIIPQRAMIEIGL